MKIIRFESLRYPARYGWLDDNHVGLLEGNPFAEYRRLEADIPLATVRLLPPVEPTKIIAVGRNYAEHAREFGGPLPDVPVFSLKPTTTLIGSGQPIYLPPQSQQVEHEAELAVVIRRTARWVTTQDAMSYVLCYSAANDITARDLQNQDGQWARAKGFDTFCPLGPCIETEFDPSDALINCRVNGELRQMASTRDMIYSIRQLIAFISSIMTLNQGDILLTGTPAGVGPLMKGDIVEISIGGIGTLSNPVMNYPAG